MNRDSKIPRRQQQDRKVQKYQRVTGSIFLLLALIMASLPAPLPAIPLDTAVPTEGAAGRVALLSGSTSCATGVFVRNDTIITNYHVASSICEYGDCAKVSIHLASSFGDPANRKVEYARISMKRSFPAIDIALIEIQPPLNLPPLEFTDRMAPGDRVWSAGFPSCGHLAMLEGQVTDIDTMHFVSSLRGAYGMSGSPVFDYDGRAKGIIIQAVGPADAALNVIFGRRFPLRAVRGDVISELLSLDETASFEREVSILNDYYLSSVLPLSGYQRLMAGFQFIAAAEGLRTKVMNETELAHFTGPFLWFDAYLGSLPPFVADSGDRGLRLEELLVAMNVELNGPYEKPFKKVDIKAFNRALKTGGRPDEHIQRIDTIVASAFLRGFPGSQILMVIYGARVLLLLLAICALWAASVSWVYMTSRGTRPRRLLVALFAAVAGWPLSLGAILLLRRKG